MHRKLYFVVLSMLLVVVSEVQAYDNKVTHKKLTEKSVESSNLSANTGRYLSKNLGQKFKKNIETIIGDKKVVDWFQEGSDFEDEGPDTNLCRASNHFHNPLKAWPQAQMTDGQLDPIGLKIDNDCAEQGWSIADEYRGHNRMALS